MNKELKEIIIKFSESGWDLLSNVCDRFLSHGDNQKELIEAIREAIKVCGNCGCSFDELYIKALKLLS